MDESPLKEGLIWTGSDDGKISITQNGGGKWEDVSIIDKGLPEYSQIYEIEPSPHDEATAYVAISNFNVYNDYKPYLFKTSDYGKTWVNMSAKFPQDQITRTIREDKVVKGLLFAGTETGTYFSMNDGETWEPLRMNMPAVPVVDIEVKGNDLVIATNGRGFWIMDDITPLRVQSAAIDAKPAHLYAIADHTRFGYNWWMDYLPGGDPGHKKNYFVQNMRPGLTYYEEGFTPVNGERKRKFIDAGDPKSLGVVIYFKLSSEPSEISLTILDKNGKALRNYTKDMMTLKSGSGNQLNDGLNKFVWDMRINRVTAVPKRPATAISPIVPPGKYTAKLTVDGVSESQDFMIFMNPKENYSQKQAEGKFDFWMQLYNSSEEWTKEVVNALAVKEDVAKKMEAYKSSGVSDSKIKKAEKQASIVTSIIDDYEGTFVSTGRTLAEVINLPATILFKMSFISGILDHSEGPAAKSMEAVYQEVVKDADMANNDYKKAVGPALEKLEKLMN